MNTLDLTYTQIPAPRSPWLSRSLGVLGGLALLQFLLLFTVADMTSGYGMAVGSLRSVVTLGAAVVVAWIACRVPDLRRWAWMFLCLSMIIGATCGALRVGGMSNTHLLLQSLVVVMYLCSLMCIALYFHGRAWWTVTTVRIILDGVLVGVACFVMIYSLLPLDLRTTFRPLLPYLAFDAGLLFALALVFTRYAYQFDPFVRIILGSFGILLAADTFYIICSMFALPLLWFVMPWYALHTVLNALAITYDWRLRPTLAPPAPLTVPTRHEWSLWTVLALLCFCGGLLLYLLVPAAPLASAVLLLVLGCVHMLLMAWDARRMVADLHQAHHQSHQARQQTEQFIARVVHDIGPPVQGLRSVLADKTWRTDQRSLHQIAQQQVHVLDTFVQQARDYVLARSAPLTCTQIALLPLCAAALRTVTDRAHQRQVVLDQEVTVDDPMVWGDATAIQRILGNVLLNAINIAPPLSEVVVSIRQPTPGWVTVAIRDHGPGMVHTSDALTGARSYQEASASPNSSSRTGTGMGLGLAIVAELTTAMGGTVDIECAPGVGTTVRVQFRTEAP